MRGLAFSSLRVGMKYYLVNYGERFEFEVVEIMSSKEFRLKDLHTLETYFMSELTKYGKGKDYELHEL